MDSNVKRLGVLLLSMNLVYLQTRLQEEIKLMPLGVNFQLTFVIMNLLLINSDLTVYYTDQANTGFVSYIRILYR